MTDNTWEQVMALYEEGGSDVEVAKLLGLTKAAFYELHDKNPNFKKIVEKGRTLSEAWAMHTLRKNITNKEFQTTLYTFMLKNRYGWADRVETKDTSEADANLNMDQLKSEIHRLAAKLEKSDPGILRTITGAK